MFAFRKSTRDSRSDYQKIDDIEIRNYQKSSDCETYPQRAQFGYRAAFYGLLATYLVTVITGIGLWNLTAIASKGSVESSEKMIEIPRDQQITFQKAEEFQEPSTMTDDDPWSSLQPAGRGFIEVPVDISHPDGSRSVEKQYFCISMFHQLHCLASLKAAFESMTSDTQEHGRHLGHCFDYLRQAVMCAGDMTLEPAYELKSEEVKVVNGWNVVHQCRNYEQMKGFAEEHRYLNSSGIL